MLKAIIQVVVAPALVAAATLAARRFGEGIGGLVSAFPAIVGPVLLVTALEHGTAFAAHAANGTLLGLVALGAFAVAYGRAAHRAAWMGSLAAGWAAAGVTGLAASTAAAGPPAGLVVAVASLTLAHRALGGRGRRASRAGTSVPPDHAPSAPASPPAATPPRWDLPLRMALTATLVVALAWAAGRLGPLVGGMLAALPVLASILAAFTHARHGPDAACALLRGILGGMAGFVAFCALLQILLDPAGIAVAFAAAATAAAATQLATARAGLRHATRTAAAATAPARA